MSAKGTFEVSLDPQTDEGFAAGRMLIDKTYAGDIVGRGVGQMISKRIEQGAAVYFAVEEFSGTVMGKNGTFTLIHKGHMDRDSAAMDVAILEGSGSDELSGISGSMIIAQNDDGHSYELKYEL